MDPSETFGAWMKRRRRSLGLTQDELAQRVAYSVVTVRKIESGELRPSKALAALLAEALGINPDERAAFIRFARADAAAREPMPLPVAALPDAPAPMPPVGGATPDAIAGTLLQRRYRLETEIGRGGLGEVYRATDVYTGETVAVKALSPDVLARDPDLVQRFAREGEALRQLNHPNIVRMIAAVEEDGRHYLVMEYMPGGTLADLLAAQAKLPAQRVTEIGLDVADALTRAHRLGIIHRDIKPANVMLAADGSPRLADFGLAHFALQPGLTQPGVLIGTVHYLSPEGCQGRALDERADIWAFGVTLFQTLSGRLPFTGDDLMSTLSAILTQPVPDLAQLAPDAPVALVDLVRRMLEKDPQQRIASVRLVGAELEALLQGREPAFAARVIQASGRFATPPAADAPRTNLPGQLSTFVGREKDIAQVKQMLAEHRLVTLTGSGGVGKTRLSIEVARESLPLYADGVWLVELALYADPALLPQAAATVFELHEDSGCPPLTVLTDYLRRKTLLLILDNCEHVTDASAQLCLHLLKQCPNLRVLASSREALGVEGEAALRVRSLSLPPAGQSTREALAASEAARLFVERAAAAAPGFALTEANALAVAQVCRRLDGIPLAIELAASRVKLLSVEQIALRLNDAFRLLTGGSRTAVPRQQTLRALIDWSYNLLAQQERLLLRRLSVFMGGWTMEAAESVCAGDGLEADEVLDVLGQLVDKSLVIGEADGGDEPRFALLETVRQYAREKLLDGGEGEAVRGRHLAYYCRLAEQAARHLHSSDMGAWLKRLDREHNNLRAALEWSLDAGVEAGLRIANGLTWFWQLRALWEEGIAWYDKLLAGPGAVDPVVRGRALGSAAWLIYFLGNNDRAQELGEQSLALCRRLADKPGMAWALTLLGSCAGASADYQRAYTLHNEALAMFRDAGVAWGPPFVLHRLGSVFACHGDLERAEIFSQQSLKLAREIGDDHATAWTLFCLGGVAQTNGAFERSLALYEESLASTRRLNSRWLIQQTERFMSYTAVRLGRFDQAMSLAEEAVALTREYGHLPDTCGALRSLAWVRRARGEWARAAAVYRESLELAVQLDDAWEINSCILGVADLASVQGQHERAARFCGALAGWYDQARSTMVPTRMVDHERELAAVRTALGDDAFAAAWQAGQAMTLEQAVGDALEVLALAQNGGELRTASGDREEATT